MTDKTKHPHASAGSAICCLAMLLALFAIGCTAASNPRPSPAAPYSEYPQLSAHCRTCKQCASPMDENGDEQSLCEEGFRLLQEDLRNATER